MRAIDRIRIKSPWYVRAWHRFKDAVINLLTIVGLLAAIVGACLFLATVGVWILLVLVIAGVTAVLVAIINRA